MVMGKEKNLFPGRTSPTQRNIDAIAPNDRFQLIFCLIGLPRRRAKNGAAWITMQLFL
jgi:hypothetical protein